MIIKLSGLWMSENYNCEVLTVQAKKKLRKNSSNYYKDSKEKV